MNKGVVMGLVAAVQLALVPPAQAQDTACIQIAEELCGNNWAEFGFYSYDDCMLTNAGHCGWRVPNPHEYGYDRFILPGERGDGCSARSRLC